MIPYSRPKLSDLYTLFQSKLLENHTLHSGTYTHGSTPSPLPPTGYSIFALVTKNGFPFNSYSNWVLANQFRWDTNVKHVPEY